MPRVRNTPVARERRTSTILEDAAFPLPISSFPTLDSIPQSARHQRKAASRHSIPGSSSTPAHIPRPRNAYVLYRSWALSYHPSIAGAKASNKQDVLSKLTGELWNAESGEVRSHFAALAAEEKERHAEKYPEYSYSPKHGGAEKVGRRRPVVTSRNVRRKKYDEDKDDYTPSSRSWASFTSSLNSPFASPSPIPEDLLVRSSASPSTSANSCEEYQTLAPSSTQRAIDEVSHAIGVKKADMKRSRLPAGRALRKRCDDDDDYVPDCYALPSFSYHHRYAPLSPDQSSVSSSSSPASPEGAQTPTNPYVTDDAACSNAIYSPSISSSGSSVESHTPPGSPKSSCSAPSLPSEDSTSSNSETDDLTESILTFPSSQSPTSSITTYIAPDELSSIFNDTQIVEDLFAPYLMSGLLPCASPNLWGTNDLFPPQCDAASDEDIFNDMICSYTNL